jgi:type VI secretion system secreted protein VgrG
MNDYNFETPGTSLEVALASTVEVGGNRRYELYEHPGEYRRKPQGEALARIRMQEIESISQVAGGTSNCRSMAAGYRFTLTGHERRELNQAYVITNVQHEAKIGTGATRAGRETYTNEFLSIPHSVPFRPLRLTPQPIVRTGEWSGCGSKRGGDLR